MAKHTVTDFYIYRWRYALGYVVIVGLLVSLLIFVGTLVPGGISNSEMTSVVASNQTPPGILTGQAPSYIIHAPYHLLQRVSISIFGLSQYSLKLPSLFLAAGAAFALYKLLKSWFRRNTAIITTVLAVTSGEFLLLAQNGTPAITYLFWSATLLYFASMLARAKRGQPVWLLGMAIAASLSLYAPLGLYILIALLVAGLIHPHVRFVIRHQSRWLLILSIAIFGLLITPLVLTLFTDPSLIPQLLGIPTNAAVFSAAHFNDLLRQYTGFYSASSSETLVPTYGLGMILLSIVGLYRLFSAKYTAKSYIISIWLVFIVLAVLVNDSLVGITLAPIFLLVAFGIDYLIRSWYKLFPLNPYARVAGLLPLSVLVIGLVLSSTERFVYGYHYDPSASAAYSHDLRLVDGELRSLSKDTPVVLTVPQNEVAFYEVYADKSAGALPPLVVTSDTTMPPKQVTWIVSHDEHDSVALTPDRVLVNSAGENADRFYVYPKGRS